MTTKTTKYFLFLLLSFSLIQAGKNCHALDVLNVNHDDRRAPVVDNNSSSHPTTTKTKTNICLNMIVKNEAHVMERLIQSVKDYIDYYVIVDTGSTDGTQELIKNTMNEYGIQGEVHDREWVNFGVNRQQALDLAIVGCHTEWVFFIDADDELVADNDPKFYEKLQLGVSYELPVKSKHSTLFRLCLANIRVSTWEWRWPVHEVLHFLTGPADIPNERLESVWIKFNHLEGGRSQGVTVEEKFLKDAAVLEAYLIDHPTDARCQFYLGRSYHDAGHLEKALDAFRKRTQMAGGWEEETFYAQLEIGNVAMQLELPEEIIVKEYMEAFNLRPSRVEPLYKLSNYFRTKENWAKAYVFAKTGASSIENNVANKDKLFVQHDLYLWRMLDEVCIVAFYVGQMAEGRSACQKILERVDNGLVMLDEATVARVRTNLEFYPVDRSKVVSKSSSCNREAVPSELVCEKSPRHWPL